MTGTSRIRPRRAGRRVSVVSCAAVVVALGMGAGGFGADNAEAAPQQLTGATLEWSVNDESNTGAFNGQCNFMSAGESDGTSTTYRSTDANATVLKATSTGGHTPVADYSSRCRGRERGDGHRRRHRSPGPEGPLHERNRHRRPCHR
ncbi:MAG: hypothetical protein V9E94_11700 [Microthrixaceae bacterium]